MPDVPSLRFYGQAFSDAEGAWPDELRRRLRREGRAVVLRHLSFFQKLRFAFVFMRTWRRMKKVDLSDFHRRGMTNRAFLDQQIEYIALFSALSKILGEEEAVEVCCRIMDETAREALLLCLPEQEKLAAFEDPLAAFTEYLQAAPEPAKAAGCQEMRIEESPRGVAMKIDWCVWLELARALGAPAACLPNCYSDGLVLPEFFAGLGLRYRRDETLAAGGSCCDFRFERPSAMDV